MLCIDTNVGTLIDDDVREEYWIEIRKKLKYKARSTT